MMKRTFLTLAVTLMLAVGFIIVSDTSSAADDAYGVIVEQTSGEQFGDDLVFTATITKDGKKVADDDALYSASTFGWAMSYYGIYLPVKDDSGEVLSGRTLTIPAAVEYLGEQTVMCEYCIDGAEGNSVVKVKDVKAPSEPRVVILDTVLKDGDSVEIGGGKVSFANHVVTFDNVSIDINDSFWGKFKATAVAVEDKDDLKFVFNGVNSIRCEIPNTYNDTSSGYLHGLAMVINDSSGNSSTVTFEGPGSLSIRAGQIGIVVDDADFISIIKIYNLSLDIQITCSDFSYKYTGAIYTRGSISIEKSTITGFTNNRHYIIAGDGCTNNDYGYLAITSSTIDVVNNDGISAGEGYVNCLSSNKAMLVVESKVTLKVTNIVGVKPCAIMHVISSKNDPGYLRTLDSEIKIVDSSTQIHSIVSVGNVGTNCEFDNTKVSLSAMCSDTYLVHSKSLVLREKSVMELTQGCSGETPYSIGMMSDSICVYNSTLDVEMQPSVFNRNVAAIMAKSFEAHNQNFGYIRAVTNMDGAFALAVLLDSKKGLEYDPAYVPTKLEIDGLDTGKYAISSGCMKFSTKNDVETIYDISGDEPVLASEYSDGTRQHESGDNTTAIVIGVVVAVLAIVIVALYIMKTRR